MDSTQGIPEQPLEPSVYSEGPLHPLRDTPSGPGIVPTNFPLYLGLFFMPFVAIAWYFTKDLDIDAGLKLVAWLFPLFAAVGPLVGWAVLQVLASRFIFNDVRRRLEFGGPRFRGQSPIPYADIVAIQVCYGGEKTFGLSSERHKVDVYELNIVFRQAGSVERLNLLCHGAGELLADQGRRIAKLVGVPFVTAGPVPTEGESR